MKANNCTACPSNCDGCLIDFATSVTGEITGKKLTCIVCAAKYKLDAAGVCVYLGDAFTQQCEYGCDKCSFNTKYSVMECSACKNNFSPVPSDTTGLINCVLACP